MNAKSLYSNKFYEELEKNSPRVDVRQTVLSGPKDANGRADFLEQGTGLEVVTKNLSTDPLIMTFGDGFSRFGQRDVTVQNDEALSWDNLPASEAEIFLYVDLLEDGTVQTGHTLLEPVYALARPSTPATGQSFYPVSHSHRMEVFDGASWVKKLRIFVGECTTDATNVTSITEYDYATGRGYEAPLGSG